MSKTINRKISIAPMMAYTDRHYRVLMRMMTRQTMLYTEMVTTGSLIYGKRLEALKFSPIEHPLALQLGGANPEELAVCAKMAEDCGYDEVNLNVGCPSDRVRSGQFGACLMMRPEVVAECVAAMQMAVDIPVTVKTRIGVDHQDSYEQLHAFIKTVASAGCQTFIIHARKAWLQGLSPRQNRTVPPLRYEVVYQLKQDFPELEFIINGGIKSWEEVQHHLEQVDGVMLGREAYENCFLFAGADDLFFGSTDGLTTRQTVFFQYLDYMDEQLKHNVPLRSMSRHLMSLFRGQPGARQWRRYLGELKD